MPSIQISSNWDILGPFQIGTREAEWGADPLRYYGGFQNLAHSTAPLFKSSLTTNGTVGWSTAQFKPTFSPGHGTMTISFNSSVVDWEFLRSIYGWSGIQYQAWARGALVVCPAHKNVPDAISVTLHISPTVEYFVNKKPYFGGDMFSYKRSPSVLHLKPGVPHTLDIRITHDIRAFGGAMPPALEIAIEADLATGGLLVEAERAIVPDVVGGKLAGKGWVSIPVRNERAAGLIEILGILAEGNGNTSPTIEFNTGNDALFRLAPGQSRPLKVRITDFPTNATNITLLIQYRVEGGSGIEHLSTSLAFPTTKPIYNPHIFTFLHPSGIVSYATLRPPSPNATCHSPPTDPPVLLSLHGAGVDVHWDSAQNVYAKLLDLCAWLLLPQGVTLWSGDDWHIWGWADVEAAIASIPDWIESTGWKGPNVDLDKWVVSGHSNGGQGAWYALTHRSDKIIAATPLSGYLSISAYVPYHMWHETDSRKSGLILAALSSYRHELLVDNYAGTPIMQGHGQLDDNVPTFHSRRMRFLSHEAGWETEYIEFPGRGHWWEGVMTDGSLPAFVNHYINEQPKIPPLPSKFSIVVANPADMGPRGGVIVEQLEVYDQLGKINIDWTNTTTWVMRTSNIRRWRIGKERPGLAHPREILLDNQSFRILSVGDMFVKSARGEWKSVHSQSWRRRERSGKQLGALDAFLNTSGHFTIVLPPAAQRKPYHQELAIEISRNLHQYYSADSDIVEDIRCMTGKGNVILIDIKDSRNLGQSATVIGLNINEEMIAVRDATGRRKTYLLEPGVGAIFLQPLDPVRVAIVVIGADENGLRSAARLVPLRTGVGQPNLIILGKEAGWKGVEGALAMGMFDSKWHLSNGFL